MILFLASYIDNNHKQMKQFVKGIFYPMLAIIPVALMIIIQPDNSTTLILLTIAFTMLFLVELFIQLATIGVFSIGTIGIFILNEKNYALGRILSFIDSSGSSASIGYQSNQALIGLKQEDCQEWVLEKAYKNILTYLKLIQILFLRLLVKNWVHCR